MFRTYECIWRDYIINLYFSYMCACVLMCKVIYGTYFRLVFLCLISIFFNSSINTEKFHFTFLKYFQCIISSLDHFIPQKGR